MVDGGFTSSGNPAYSNNVSLETYRATNLPYSLGSIIGDQSTGSIRETQHSGITVELTYYPELQKVNLYLERYDAAKFKTYNKQVGMYPRGTSGGSFDIYNSRTGGTDIGDGYAYDDGQTRYTLDVGNGVEMTFLVSGHVVTSGGGRGRNLGRGGIYASKQVLDGYDLREQPIYRNETFSLLGLPATHFLRIGTNAQLTKQSSD